MTGQRSETGLTFAVTLASCVGVGFGEYALAALNRPDAQVCAPYSTSAQVAVVLIALVGLVPGTWYGWRRKIDPWAIVFFGIVALPLLALAIFIGTAEWSYSHYCTS